MLMFLELTIPYTQLRSEAWAWFFVEPKMLSLAVYFASKSTKINDSIFGSTKNNVQAPDVSCVHKK